MANPYSDIRVGIDWENKGFMCWGASPGDALNLAPVINALTAYGASGLTATYKIDNPVEHRPTPMYYDIAATSGVAASVKFYDETGTRYIPLAANTTYTLTFFYQLPGFSWGASSSATLVMHTFNGTTPVGTHTMTLVDPPITTVLCHTQQLEFTTGASVTRGRLMLNLLSSPAHSVTQVKIRGFMVTQTTAANAPVYYNSGTSACLWDDVSDYVVQAEAFTGYSERFNLMPDEGTATVILNNAGRHFTPREITGVYPGDYASKYLDIGMPVVIQAGGLSPYSMDWKDLFTGTIKELQVDTGRYRDRQITVSCEQAMKAMDRHYGDIGIVPSRTLRQHIETVFAGGGAYTVWKYPFVRLDDPNRTLDDAFLYTPSVLLLGSGNGATTGNPGITMDWPQSLSETVKNVVDFDGGLFFVLADGITAFYSRSYLTGATPAETWDYEDFSEDTYVYNSDLANVIELDYVSQPLTLNPGSITLGANTLRLPVATDGDITVVYDYNKTAMGTEYSYGNHITQTLLIKKVSDGSTIGSGVGISFIDELDTSGRTDNSLNAGWGTQVRFRLYNYTGFEVDITVTVTGEGCLPDTTAVTEYVENASVLKYGRRTKKYSNPYITDNTYASNYKAQKMAKLAYPQQYFKTLATFIHAGNYAYLGKQLGMVIELAYEYQTESVDLPMVIIGKGFSWQPQQLRLEFTMGPVV